MSLDSSSRKRSRADAEIAVPVTGAWTSHDAARRVDDEVVQSVPNMAAWMASLSHELRLDLLGRVSTNALLGEPVIVVSEHSGWSEVRLPWQPCASDPRGYPAWIPSAHLAPSSARIAIETDGGEDVEVDADVTNGVGAGEVGEDHGESSMFCVTRRLVPVRASRAGAPVEVLSLGTRLPVVDVDPATGTNHAQVQVASSHGTYWIDADCGIYARSTFLKLLSPEFPLPDASTAGIIAAGSELLGLPYLWGGLSGWGVDCSGLVHLAHRAMGLMVPRDSVDQLGVFGPVQGVPAVGQPVFFRYRTDSLRIHHVGLAVSGTTMLHAPKTGRVVEFLPIATEPYGSELERTA
jgi:gamma-D-glutamyl-L-lysine dipeptidyl-peptidase